jgi:hypothetical protein
MEQFDDTTNAGRKGIAYDWQSVLAADEAAHEATRVDLDRELAALTPQYAK